MEGTLEAGLETAEGSGKPCGMPWITPYLMVKDASASLAFYEAAFGFARRHVKLGPDGSIMHAEATWQDGLIMLGPEGGCGGTIMSPATQGIASPVTIYVYCGDVDAVFDRAVALGATVKFPPHDSFWGDRVCMIVDLDGHSWNFATNKGKINYE
jgi:uncharacterized glyoxalase superfamily protein PhnB